MKETLVSFELAKKLKEIGFNWACEGIDEIGNHFSRRKHPYDHTYWEMNDNGEPEKKTLNVIYPQPSLSIAQKWFREERGIYICIDFEYTYKKGVECFCDISTIHASERFDSLNLKYQSNNFKTYEQALEAGLLKACEIIKKK